jgi:hypothetical protein
VVTRRRARSWLAFAALGGSAALLACGTLVGLGDPPSGGDVPDAGAAAGDASRASDATEAAVSAGDAAPDAASADLDAGVDTSADAYVDLPPGASCLDLHTRFPSAPSGVYSIRGDDGGTFDAFCNMTLGDGGWTAFYAGTLGARNVFAHFDRGGYLGDPPDDCEDPAARCLRHVPATVTLQTQLAVACGANAVTFTPSDEILAYFQRGVSGGWLPLGAPTALTPSAHDEWATYLWAGGYLHDGGADGNLGWIISHAAFTDGDSGDHDQEHTFASAYDSRSWGWDYCDGTDFNDLDANTPFDASTPGPRVYLYYR